MQFHDFPPNLAHKSARISETPQKRIVQSFPQPAIVTFLSSGFVAVLCGGRLEHVTVNTCEEEG